MDREMILAALIATAVPIAGQAQMTTTGRLLGSEGWYFTTADRAGEVFVFEVGTGTGTPVVVLHGGPGADFTYLLPIAQGLESDFRFVFYDQRGSLHSRVTLDSISMAKHVADLEQLRQALGAERLKLVAHSAGTLLAFEYLREYPHRVENLALVGALPHKNGTPYFDAEYARLWQGLADSARAFMERDAITNEIRGAGLDRAGLTPKERSHVALIRQVGAETYHVERWRNALPMRVNAGAGQRTRQTTNFEYDMGPVLARHGFPVSVINGEFDYTVGPRGSPLWRSLAASVAPNVQVVVIPEASHLVWRDDPERFSDALRQALLPE